MGLYLYALFAYFHLPKTDNYVNIRIVLFTGTRALQCRSCFACFEDCGGKSDRTFGSKNFGSKVSEIEFLSPLTLDCPLHPYAQWSAVIFVGDKNLMLAKQNMNRQRTLEPRAATNRPENIDCNDKVAVNKVAVITRWLKTRWLLWQGGWKQGGLVFLVAWWFQGKRWTACWELSC